MEDEKPVVALRVPPKTYAILKERSIEWQMSVSGVVREVIIKIFNESDQKTMKSYRNRERVKKNGDDSG